jgi:hypothetical protein
VRVSKEICTVFALLAVARDLKLMDAIQLYAALANRFDYKTNDLNFKAAGLLQVIQSPQFFT